MRNKRRTASGKTHIALAPLRPPTINVDHTSQHILRKILRLFRTDTNPTATYIFNIDLWGVWGARTSRPSGRSAFISHAPVEHIAAHLALC